MAASVYKWLTLSVLSSFFLLEPAGVHNGDSFSPLHTTARLHPFHVSVIEVNHNASEQSLEISCKIFTDDFEKILAKTYNKKVDLTNPPVKADMDTLVKKYLFSHLLLKVNGKLVHFSYVGYEPDQEAVYGYIEATNVPAVSKVDVSTNIMYDFYEDQMNILHVIVGGKRQSTKLNFPETETVMNF